MTDSDTPAAILAGRIADALGLAEDQDRCPYQGRYWSSGHMGIWNRRTTMNLPAEANGVMVLHWPPNESYSYGLWIGFDETFIEESGDPSKAGLFLTHHQFAAWDQGPWSGDSTGTDLLTEHERSLTQTIDNALDGLITYALTTAGETACLAWLRGEREGDED